MPDIRPGDIVRFRFGMLVHSVDGDIVKFQWTQPCTNCIGYEIHEFTAPASCLDVVHPEVSETSLAGGSIVISAGRVPIDPDADLYAAYADVIVTDDPEADEPYVIGNAD